MEHIKLELGALLFMLTIAVGVHTYIDYQEHLVYMKSVEVCDVQQ